MVFYIHVNCFPLWSYWIAVNRFITYSLKFPIFNVHLYQFQSYFTGAKQCTSIIFGWLPHETIIIIYFHIFEVVHTILQVSHLHCRCVYVCLVVYSWIVCKTPIQDLIKTKTWFIVVAASVHLCLAYCVFVRYPFSDSIQKRIRMICLGYVVFIWQK